MTIYRSRSYPFRRRLWAALTARLTHRPTDVDAVEPVTAIPATEHTPAADLEQERERARALTGFCHHGVHMRITCTACDRESRTNHPLPDIDNDPDPGGH